MSSIKKERKLINDALGKIITESVKIGKAYDLKYTVPLTVLKTILHKSKLKIDKNDPSAVLVRKSAWNNCMTDVYNLCNANSKKISVPNVPIIYLEACLDQIRNVYKK